MALWDSLGSPLHVSTRATLAPAGATRPQSRAWCKPFVGTYCRELHLPKTRMRICTSKNFLLHFCWRIMQSKRTVQATVQIMHKDVRGGFYKALMIHHNASLWLAGERHNSRSRITHGTCQLFCIPVCPRVRTSRSSFQ